MKLLVSKYKTYDIVGHIPDFLTEEECDSLFETNADDNFVEMFDKEIANTSSKSVDIGIAEAIIRQMSLQKNGDPS